MSVSWLLQLLLLTVLIELVVAWLLGYKSRQALWVVVLANIITNPPLNFLIALNVRYSFFYLSWTIFLGLELLVILIEWFIFSQILKNKRSKLFWLSLAINIASFIAGLFIF